ncbi:DASH complex subunit Hsk3 like-domain-containing protein [Paraphoma chrysanthemicola]|uniref:DASH complex subunit Hsk3 like-domain-containing protein n=1 Tax=Paraphoma chrysanthemicola TaxID=798071 RepID=A0A8K0R8S2_9PLEO|nr:DASH complex subunit Hsk3 like-domain-containing protein [Paraphoma chrysanthemicola]
MFCAEEKSRCPNRKPVAKPAPLAAGVPDALPTLRYSTTTYNTFADQRDLRTSCPLEQSSDHIFRLIDCTMSNLPRSQPSNSRLSTVPSQKPRQLSHLQAQLAQLTANMADLESLMRMTAGQAQDMRGLGGYSGAMFMAASKVLGEETVKGGDDKGAKEEGREGEK